MRISEDTLDSRYYDTVGIRKMYYYNQTIDITSLNFYCLGMVGIHIWYCNKQYFVITGILITRVYCMLWYWLLADVLPSVGVCFEKIGNAPTTLLLLCRKRTLA
jgi:hypothetical protein